MSKRYERSPPHGHSRYRKASRDSSKSRSREKKPRKPHGQRDHKRDGRDYREPMAYIPIKMESDIKNHFKFEIPHFNRNQQAAMIGILKNKLTEFVGPIEHVTEQRETRNTDKTVLLVGFKYDIDAISYMHQGTLTIKTESGHKIQMNPIPTQAFEYLIADFSERVPNHSFESRPLIKESRKSPPPPRSSKQRPRTHSSSSSSDKQSKNGIIAGLTRVLVFGIPSQAPERKFLNCVNELMGSNYHCKDYCWRKVRNTSCEYFQFLIEPSKAAKIISYGDRFQVNGRPLVIVEDKGSLSQKLMDFQILIQTPKSVHPSHLLRAVQNIGRVVQLIALQKPQQDTRCRVFGLTLNNWKIAAQMRKLGRLSSEILVKAMNMKLYVYRPDENSMLPSRQQLGLTS